MKQKIAIIIFVNFLILNCFSQEYGKFKIGKEFNSVFQNLKNGKFDGTINGVLFLKNTNNNDLSLDFQAGKSELNIIHDSNEVYDLSYKKYTGWTTSRKTKIYYSTYASANKLSIELSSGIFTIGSHDGASDMVVNGINYEYKSEKDVEYLIITFDKNITLDNFWWLRNQNIPPEKADKMEKEITIKKSSVLIFIMNR